MKNRKVTKAVITAGGFGTRFLPTTKSIPKEMIPILEYPTIHYIVKELVDSGITDIIVVTRKSQPNTMSYFEPNLEVENFLKENQKDDVLKKTQELTNVANFSFINQNPKLPYGSTSPVLSAKQWLGDDNFALVYCDDLVLSDVPATRQLIDVFQKNEDIQMVISAQEVSWEEVHKYGIVEFKKDLGFQLDSLVEKPKREDAKSNLAYFGRHVCSPMIFDILDEQEKEKRKENENEKREFYFSDCINILCKRDRVFVKKIDGDWLTTGDPLNLLRANLKFALSRGDLKDSVLNFLKNEIF